MNAKRGWSETLALIRVVSENGHERGGNVVCPSCGHENRTGAKFCAQCATQLPDPCASCGFELSPNAKFCDQCGAPVANATTEGPPGQAKVTRRVVTVLFADLVGSTSFGEQVDAESARDVLADYHAAAREVVEAAGGRVTKFIGDGVMALFGVPEIAEDDADRAVAAGRALQRRFAPIRDRVVDRHGADLGLRVGINTGELVLADDDTDVVGDAVNTAARLEATCRPGEVLVGEDTWRLTRSHVQYEVLGEVEVKGKDRPVATFQVVDSQSVDEQVTPFVGRVDELARLRQTYDDAVAKRVARLATVVGSPGVGKTRIASEFCQSVADEVTVAFLRCERSGTATFAPIADLLRSITNFEDDADSDRTRAAMRELVAELDDADRVADLLAGFVGAAPVRSTEEAFLAVRRLVEAAARRRPLVIVVDDIQWAEPLFLDLLEHLAEWVNDAPAFLIGLARPEIREIRSLLAEENRTIAASISLEGLDPDATAELAARLVGAESLPSDLVARLPASTEGNPLFVRELMRMLVDDGVIEQVTDGWHLTIDAEAVEVPPTIQSLLAARLDRMPAGERRLVELASVVGPEFALGAVSSMSDADIGGLRLSLERLRRRELVDSTGMYWGDEPIYRFHHVLIRDAAYRRLLKRTRADLHQRVGEWTERTAAGLPGENEVAIGYHFEQAHDYHRQLGDTDDGIARLGRRAAELFGLAAERALQRDDLPAAVGLAERALARLDQTDAEVPSMLIVAAEALVVLGDVGRGRPLVGRLATLVADHERLQPWADAFEAQLTILTEPDRVHDAAEQSDRAARRLAELGDEAGVGKARLVRALALARLGRVGESEAELDLALTAARSAGDRRCVAAVLGAAPLAALWGPSPIPRAGGRCLDVIRLLRITTGSPAVEATSVRCQAVLEALRGRFDTARAMLVDSRATVEELGLRHALGETDLFTGIVELLAGDPDAAEGPLRAAYEGLGRLGIGADVGQAAAYLARSVLQQGRVDEAEALAAESTELAGENLQTAIAARTAQAEILAAQGRYGRAVDVARDAVARAEGTDIIVDHAAASAVLARVADLAGDSATAVRAGRVASELYEQKGATVVVSKAPNLASGPSLSGHSGGETEGDEQIPLNEADRLTRRFVELFTTGAREEWLAMLSPSQVTRDRRPLVGVDTSGADGVANAYPRDRETRGMTSTVETLAVRGEAVALVRWRAVSGSGREWDSLHLTRWTEDGLCDLNVVFPIDQLAEALVELDRLHLEASGGLAAARGWSAHEPWNEADRLSRRLTRSFAGRSSESWYDMLDPAHVSDDRRAIVAYRTEGRDQTVEVWAESAAGREGDPPPTSIETLAVRGDHLVLQLLRSETPFGDASPALQLLRWNEHGRCDLLVRFAAGDQREAMNELDRQWSAALSSRQWGVSRLAVTLGRAWVAPSDHSFDGLLADEFQLVDGRTLGVGALDRTGFEVALRGREADGTTGPPVATRAEFVSDGVMVFRANNLGHAPGSGIDWEEVACNVLVVEGDLIARLEMFDEDDWAGALARARELAATVDGRALG